MAFLNESPGRGVFTIKKMKSTENQELIKKIADLEKQLSEIKEKMESLSSSIKKHQHDGHGYAYNL